MIAGRDEQLADCGGSSALYDFVPTDEELQAKQVERNNNGKEEHVYATPCVNNYDLPLTSADNDLKRSDDASSLTVDENRPYCRALYDFSSEYDNELSFSAGEIIYLTHRVNDEWLEGEIGRNGQRGIFPTNFVEIVVDFSRPQENDLRIPNDSSLPPLEPPSDNDGAKNTTFSSVSSVVGMALAVDDFAARFSDELSLHGGDSVRVLELVDDNWARCQSLADNRVGIVPQSYLQIFLDSDDSYNFAATSTPVNELKSFAASIANVSNEAETMQSTGFHTSSPPTVGAKLHPALPPPLPVNMDAFGQSSSGSGNDSFYGGGTLRTSPMRAAKKQQSQLKQQKQAPMRPPPPKKLSASPFGSNFDKPLSFENATGIMVPASTSSDSLVPPVITTTTSGYDAEDQKKRVVQDLLSTEITYLFDLDTWQTCIARSKTLKEETKCVLNNGLPLLKQLSQTLIDNIRAEKEKPISDQCYGQMFMGMREMFFRTFSNHCRCVEQIGQILENNGEDTGNNNADNDNTQEALNQCIMEMRRMGSNIFDVPTAVSRPIQRCLKYPLYVGELLKNTPINHIDHPKLMEAVKQLGSLASKMNECKRRKELIRKYREDQQLSLAERLSRINVHSFVKKSNRLKYRISSTMGFNTVRDSEFDNLIMWLDGAERRVCKFLYCAQLYKKNIEVAFKRHEDSYRGLCPVQEESALQAFSSTFRALDQIQKDFFQQLENEIINEGKTLTRCEYTKLIHKRCDKLADYETAKAANKSSSETERRRNEYEALNNQVKSGLPKTISFINKKVIQLVHLTHQIDDRLMQRMDQWYREERPPSVRTLAVDVPDFGRFVVQTCRNRFHEMDKILRFDSQNQLQQSQNQNFKINKNDKAGSVKSSKNGSRSVARRSASLRLVNTSTAAGSKRSLKNPFATSASSTTVESRCQTPKQRDALIKIMRAQNALGDLRRVSAPFASARLELNVDDVVIVKRHKTGVCLCDNGVATDYVPMECLRMFDDVDESFNGSIVGGSGGVPTRVAPAIPTRTTPQPPTTASRSTFYDLLTDTAVTDFDGGSQRSSLQPFRPVSLPALDSSTKATTMTTKQPSIFDCFDELFESSKPTQAQLPVTTASSNNNFGFDGGQSGLLTAGIVPPPPTTQHRRHPSPLTFTLSQSNNTFPFATQNLTTTSGIMTTNDTLKPTIKGTKKPQNDLIDLDEDLIDLGNPTSSRAPVTAQAYPPTVFPVNEDTSGLLTSGSGLLL